MIFRRNDFLEKVSQRFWKLRVGLVQGEKQIEGPGSLGLKYRILFLPLEVRFIDEIDGLDFLLNAVFQNLEIVERQVIYELIALEDSDWDFDVYDPDIIGELLWPYRRGDEQEPPHRIFHLPTLLEKIP
jgi:hypothetical protein